MSVHVIYNPVAGAGKAGRDWKQTAAMLERHFGPVDAMATSAPGDASAMAHDLGRNGARLVLACGGDGTVSEVADGLLRARSEKGSTVPMGVLPIGTGSDFSRTLGVTSDLNEMAGRIARGNARQLDAGRLDFVSDDGALHSRHFVNIASLGLSGPTDRAVNKAKTKARFGGKLVFMMHTVAELLRYKFQDVVITVDDQKPIEARIAVVAIANGRYFGGGMKIAPDAQPDDGQFEVVIFRAANKFQLIRNMNLLYTGAHVKLDEVTILRGRKIGVEPAGGAPANYALLDIDGESPGRIPATFEILPSALTVHL